MGAVSSCWRKDNGPSVGFDVFSDCQCPTDVDHRVEMKGMVALPLSPYLTTVAGQMGCPTSRVIQLAGLLRHLLLPVIASIRRPAAFRLDHLGRPQARRSRLRVKSLSGSSCPENLVQIVLDGHYVFGGPGRTRWGSELTVAPSGYVTVSSRVGGSRASAQRSSCTLR